MIDLATYWAQYAVIAVTAMTCAVAIAVQCVAVYFLLKDSIRVEGAKIRKGSES